MVQDEVELVRELYDRHAAALWRYVVHLTGDRALAEDVVQETLTRAWRKLPALDETEGSARAWLFTVARNIVIDGRRSARSRHEISTDAVPEPVTVDVTEALLDSWMIADALATLSLEHRAVIVHVYYGGRSIAETARELDIPEGTVKSRLHYATQSLRLVMREKGVTR